MIYLLIPKLFQNVPVFNFFWKEFCSGFLKPLVSCGFAFARRDFN